MAELAMQWNKINSLFLLDEKRAVERLLEHTSTLTSLGTAVCDIAQELVLAVRQQSKHSSAVDALMHEYDLSTDEGIVLMCLAEALLRIPDADTADRLIRDKLRIADWKQHMGHSHSLFVNASTWGLMVSGQLVNWHGDEQQAQHFFTRLVSRLGEPIVRTGIRQAMRVMGHQFVMGRSIEEAQQRSDEDKNSLYRYSFDMLGEAALTQESAEKYLNAYRYAISRLGANKKDEDLIGSDSISVKLSALHPRYEFSKKERLERELFHALLTLAQQARELNIALTIDAEEAERLEISLRVFEQVFTHESLKGWSGLGLAVQAYQKRAPAVIDWLEGLANNCQKTIPVRLVKGAYWDTEIKRAQERGWAGYPVYTQKYHTDLSYLVCAQKLLNSTAFYPQFATHNAHTIASIIQLAQGDLSCFEFQRLHGMGEALYKEVKKRFPVACRIYAPVGSYEDLLPYLVRRLLENGANTSFVNRIEHEDVSV
ncbi:MAG: proline dehydrogenase family protein, partial [Gammaproteobacteria bacterium]|nr:proline dehydrogenase family protein [Gammaproteobacteria bacterium]